MGYYTDLGPGSGPILRRDRYGAIGVMQARDDHSPIGMALSVGWGEGGVALWKLTVHVAELPRRWVVDSESRPARA